MTTGSVKPPPTKVRKADGPAWAADTNDEAVRMGGQESHDRPRTMHATDDTARTGGAHAPFGPTLTRTDGVPRPRAARQRYGFRRTLFGLTGNVVFTNFAAARRFAQKMNEQRAAEIATDPGSDRRAGDLNAMGLIDEILHYVIELYREQRNPELLEGDARRADGRAWAPASRRR